MEQATVVVTGGAGFIGSHTVRLLASRGLGVVALDVAAEPRLPFPPGVRLVIADVAVWGSLWQHLRPLRGNLTGIIHLAAVVSIEEARQNPLRALRVNVEGTLNVLEAARRLDVETVVYASSAAVYGEPRYLPVDEAHPRSPANFYGDTKLMGEMLVERYAADYGIRTVSLRYFNVYGPGMRGGPYAGVIHAFIESLLRRKPPTIYGDGEQTRDFVYVEDVAEANYLALVASNTRGTINIGTGVETSINKLYKMICRIVGYCPEPRRAPPRPGDVRRSVASIEKARHVLGWSPRVSLPEGLRLTVEWYRSIRV